MGKPKAILVAFLMLLVAASVSAAPLACEVWDANVGAITFSTPVYQSACYHFDWTRAASIGGVGTDFNNYVVRATSLDEDLNLSGAAGSILLCSFDPGESVTLYVRGYGSSKSNKMFCGFDYNVTAGSATVAQAGGFLVYSLLAAFGIFIGLIIFVVVVGFIITKLHLKIPGMK